MKILKQLFLLFFIGNLSMFSQIKEPIVDSIKTNFKGTFETSIDVMSRYIWRGQSWGGNYIVVQPTLNYFITNKLKVGIWATSNFKKQYLENDEITSKGYQEIDVNVSYQFNDYLTILISDYYWPTTQKVEGISNNYFNYGKDGVKTVDLNFLFDFSDVWKPLTINASTFIAGNDFKYDENGGNAKQNFTTYLEVGYKLENIFSKISKKTFQKIDLSSAVGAVLNNQAKYYNAADYNKISFVNLGLKVNKEFEINKKYALPIYLTYTYNAAKDNTEVYGRNFLVAGISIKTN